MKNPIENNIGLKWFFKQHKEYNLRHKIKRLYWELKYAWHRAWYGYDDVDVFNCDVRFQERMIAILEDYKNSCHCYWNLPQESEHYEELKVLFPEGHLSKNAMNSVIDTMIWHLKMIDEDFCEKQLFGNCIQDDDYVISCRTMEDYKRIGSVIRQNKNCFMKLFSMFYFDLWD